jgi:hypothetical protein
MDEDTCLSKLTNRYTNLYTNSKAGFRYCKNNMDYIELRPVTDYLDVESTYLRYSDDGEKCRTVYEICKIGNIRMLRYIFEKYSESKYTLKLGLTEWMEMAIKHDRKQVISFFTGKFEISDIMYKHFVKIAQRAKNTVLVKYFINKIRSYVLRKKLISKLL